VCDIRPKHEIYLFVEEKKRLEHLMYPALVAEKKPKASGLSMTLNEKYHTSTSTLYLHLSL